MDEDTFQAIVRALREKHGDVEIVVLRGARADRASEILKRFDAPVIPPEILSADYLWPLGPTGAPGPALARGPHPSEAGDTPKQRARMKTHQNVRRRPPRRI